MPQNTRRYFEESGQLLEGRKPESPEFAALMRSKVGDRFKELVTPQNLGLMALIGDPKERYNYSGLNFPAALDNPDRARKRMENSLGTLVLNRPSSVPVLSDGQQELPEGKRIFGLGAGADAGTYAHELRHERIRGDELENRMLDLVHSSTSLPAYKENIVNTFNYMVMNYDGKQATDIPFHEKEKYVLDGLNYSIKHEAPKSGFTATKPDGFYNVFDNDFLSKNVRLNKAGAVGAFDASKNRLPKDFIDARAKLPFLNFVGRIEEPAPTKKRAGGMIENTTHDRKIL